MVIAVLVAIVAAIVTAPREFSTCVDVVLLSPSAILCQPWVGLARVVGTLLFLRCVSKTETRSRVKLGVDFLWLWPSTSTTAYTIVPYFQ